ncbi:MAG: flagellar basal body P-ring formation chaperone FlgA [Deltaproteobacteria bacterium]|jgi:flagella basal body P-ring formation protein FlgA|nr:flagellar basal body P-ring formation chaperone FlgA [Deltaproteobacteria bacterium]
MMPGSRKKTPGGLTIGAAVLALVLFAAASAASAGVHIIFPSENTVDGPRIVLGDIASVAPDSPFDQELADLLSAFDLGPSPKPGRKMTLRRQIIEQKLLAGNIPVSEVRWNIPEEVVLTGGGQSAGDAEVKKIILEYLSRSEPYISGRFELISLTSGPVPVLPPGQAEYRFVPLPSSNPVYLTGTVFFSVDGREAARLRITGQIDLQMPAVVAARDLPRGQILSEGDLSESLVAYNMAKGALTEASQAVGQTIRVSLRAGAPVKERDLVKTAMIKKGETVTIIAQSGGLRVTALGQAKQDGSLGQTIAVVNQDSRKTVSGRVIGPGMVEVIF